MEQVVALPIPETPAEALASLQQVNRCRRVSPSYPPPFLAAYADAAVVGEEALAQRDRAATLQIATDLYTFGAALGPASLGEYEHALTLQVRALDLLVAAGAQPTELGILDGVWRFEAGPAASLVGEADLVRQLLGVESLSRRDRRACEDYAAWTLAVGRSALGLPHEVQLGQIGAAIAERPLELRACASDLPGQWARIAEGARDVRARVVALTLPVVAPAP